MATHGTRFSQTPPLEHKDCRVLLMRLTAVGCYRVVTFPDSLVVLLPQQASLYSTYTLITGSGPLPRLQKERNIMIRRTRLTSTKLLSVNVSGLHNL